MVNRCWHVDRSQSKLYRLKLDDKHSNIDSLAEYLGFGCVTFGGPDISDNATKCVNDDKKIGFFIKNQ